MAKASGRREEPAPPAHVFHFPVDEFILHQTPHLSVQHPVKLGAQDNKIAEMAVHGKKPVPAVTAFCALFTGVKHKLGLIHYQKDAVFFHGAPVKFFP